MTNPLRVLVADSLPLLRTISRHTITQAGIQVVGEATSTADLVEQARRFGPDVAVCASDFADGPLLSVIERVLTTGARVLVLCHTISPDRAADLLLAGASGYLSSPDVGAPELVEAIREVARGNAALHPAAATAVLNQWRALRKPPDDIASQTPLTDREVEVLSAIAAGLTNRGIGQRLGVSAKTVEAHKSRIFAKLGVKNQVHALTLATAQGLLRLPATTGPATPESGSTSD